MKIFRFSRLIKLYKLALNTKEIKLKQKNQLIRAKLKERGGMKAKAQRQQAQSVEELEGGEAISPKPKDKPNNNLNMKMNLKMTGKELSEQELREIEEESSSLLNNKNESNISRILSSSTMKKVIIVILLIMLSIPVFDNTNYLQIHSSWDLMSKQLRFLLQGQQL